MKSPDIPIALICLGKNIDPNLTLLQ